MQFVIFLPEEMVHLKIFLKRFASDGLAGFHSISIAADTSSPPLTATNPRTFLPAADILCTSLSLPHAFHSHTHILLLPRPPPSPPRALPAPPLSRQGHASQSPQLLEAWLPLLRWPPVELNQGVERRQPELYYCLLPPKRRYVHVSSKYIRITIDCFKTLLDLNLEYIFMMFFLTIQLELLLNEIAFYFMVK
jgi:hypothetical protein